MSTRWWLCLAVAAVVTLPSLNTGAVLDDWMQRALVRRTLTQAGPMDLFTFADGDETHMHASIDRGPYPWFTAPDLRLSFFRPVSSALINFDTRVFGDVLWPQHLHSTLWYVACVALVAALLRRSVPAVAWLATLLFAIDDAHVMPVMWLANRNALLAVTFVWLGLWAHLRWREDGWRPGAWLSPLAAALGLASGETGVAALAYVFAYELFGRAEPLPRRLRALGPTVLVLLGFVVLYRVMGSGAHGSATYIDPVREPVPFLINAPERFLANVGSQSSGIPAELWLSIPSTRPLLIGLGGLSVVLWFLAWRRWRPELISERRTLTWLGVGAVAALIPTLATFPASRLLMAPSLGLAAWVATLLSRAWADVGVRKWAGVLWLGGAFVLQPLTSWIALPMSFTMISEKTQAAVLAPEIRSTDRVVIVSSSDFAPPVYGVPVLLEAKRPIPLTWHIWSMAPLAHRLVRVSERVVELEALDGAMVESVFEQNFRSTGTPFLVGQRIPLDGMTLEVSKVKDGAPTAIRVALALAPEAYRFLTWDGDVFRELRLPDVGAALDLERVPTLFEQLMLGTKARSFAAHQ